MFKRLPPRGIALTCRPLVTRGLLIQRNRVLTLRTNRKPYARTIGTGQNAGPDTPSPLSASP